jgi:hypothetical protein
VKNFLTQIKIVVKPSFDNIDEIKFEAALTANSIETKHKQKQYAS